MTNPDRNQGVRNSRWLLACVCFACIMLAFSCKTPDSADKGKPGKKLSQSEQLQLTALFIDANREKALGNDDKALGLFAQCIKRESSYAPAMYEMARIFEQNNQLGEARAMAISAVKYEAGNEWYQLLLAGIHVKLREYTEAAKILKELADKHTETPDYATDLANVYLLAGRYPDAIKIYDDVERKFGISEEISLEKERLYLQMGKINKAIDEIQKLLDAFPGEIKYMGIIAELYLSAGEEMKGLDMYQKILAIDPTDPYVHLSLADYYKARKNEQKSFDELCLAFANESLDIDKKVRILLKYLDRAEYDTLAKSQGYILCRITTETHPEEAKAWSVSGDFYFGDGKLPEAAEAFRKVIGIDSSKYVVWSQLLIIDSQLEDIDRLENESARAMELFPDQAEPYLYNGYANTKLQHYSKALKSLRTGLNFAVESSLILKFQMNIGDLCYKMGDYDASFEAYEKALKLEPLNVYVLEKYSLGLVEQKQNLIRAEELSRKLTDKVPDNTAYEDVYARALFLQAKFEDAKTIWERILGRESHPDPKIFERYGDVLYKLGDVDNAVKNWMKAKDAGLVSDTLNRKINDRKWYE